MSREVVVVVGAGRVGLSIAIGLAHTARFRPIVVVGRSAVKPEFLGSRPGVEYVSTGGAGSLLADAGGDGALRLVLAVPDDELSGVAAEWARRMPAAAPEAPSVVLHTSGFYPAQLLEPFRAAGAAVGSWHPLLALASPTVDAFRGVTVGIEGDPGAVEWASVIGEALGALPVRVATGEKARYHAAAVFASNYLVACLRVAGRELESATEGAVGEAALIPLARAAIENVARHGIERGATGPLVRGDVRTVAGHLRTLDPRRAALYRALGRELLEAVGERLPAPARARLIEVLEEEGP